MVGDKNGKIGRQGLYSEKPDWPIKGPGTLNNMQFPKIDKEKIQPAYHIKSFFSDTITYNIKYVK